MGRQERPEGSVEYADAGLVRAESPEGHALSCFTWHRGGKRHYFYAHAVPGEQWQMKVLVPRSVRADFGGDAEAECAAACDAIRGEATRRSMGHRLVFDFSEFRPDWKRRLARRWKTAKPRVGPWLPEWRAATAVLASVAVAALGRVGVFATLPRLPGTLVAVLLAAGLAWHVQRARRQVEAMRFAENLMALSRPDRRVVRQPAWRYLVPGSLRTSVVLLVFAALAVTLLASTPR